MVHKYIGSISAQLLARSFWLFCPCFFSYHDGAYGPPGYPALQGYLFSGAIVFDSEKLYDREFLLNLRLQNSEADDSPCSDGACVLECPLFRRRTSCDEEISRASIEVLATTDNVSPTFMVHGCGDTARSSMPKVLTNVTTRRVMAPKT